MTRASDDVVDALHGIVADSLIQQIKAAQASGEAIPPALLAQAIKFLKDNGVDAPARQGSKVDTLKEAMPDFDEHTNVTPFRKSL